MKRVVKWLLGLLLLPVVLLVLLVVLIYLPPVQQWLVGRAADYASEQTGMTIRIERFRLTPLLDVDLQGLSVLSDSDFDVDADTLLCVEHALVDLELRRILDGHIAVEAIELRGGRFDSQRLIATLRLQGRVGLFRLRAEDIALQENTVQLTAASLSDSHVDIALRDTTVEDTTESVPLPWRLAVGDALVTNSSVAFHTAGDSLSIVAALDTLRVQGGYIDLLAQRYCMQSVCARADSIVCGEWAARSVALDADDVCVSDSLLCFPHIQLTTDSTSILLSTPLALTVSALGNTDVLRIDSLRLTADGMADVRMEGRLAQLLQFDSLEAQLRWDIRTHDLLPLRRLLSLPRNVALPRMHLTGTTAKQLSRYEADLQLHEAAGSVKLQAECNTSTEQYSALLGVRRLNLHHFLPADSLYHLTASAAVEGRGFDFRNRATRLKAQAAIDQLQYGAHDFSNMRLVARLQRGSSYVDVSSDNDILTAQACAELELRGKETVLENFVLDLSRIDLHALRLTKKPLTASLHMHLDGSSDFRYDHRLSGRLQAIELHLADTVLHPLDLDLSAQLQRDSLHALAHAGDLELELAAAESMDSLLTKVSSLSAELSRQLSERQLDQSLLRSLYPAATLHLSSGAGNPIGNFLAHVHGYRFRSLQVDLSSSPQRGIRGRGSAVSFNTGGMLIDTIQWYVRQNENSKDAVQTMLRVKNGPKNKQVVFESTLRAQVTPTGATANLQFLDAKGKKGVDLGAVLELEEEGMRLRLHPLNPVIAYRNFTLNDSNYIFLGSDQRIEADIDLLADDGTGFKLYTTPNDDALQDITLSVHNVNLGELSDVLPYMPDVRGLLAGDFHLVQDEQTTSVSADARVAGMVYQGAPLGDIGLNALYLPNADGTHYVDGIVSHDDEEVLLLTGTYSPDGDGTLDGQIALQRLPVSLANGFIPDQTATLSGFLLGDLTVTGPIAAPQLDGTLCTDALGLRSDMYSINLRFPDDTIRIKNSLIDLDRIEARTAGRAPLVLDGTIDARNTSAIALDLSVRSKNFELINAPKTRQAVAYGKVFVDLDTRLTGTLNDLRLRGALKVLGNTDVTYVLTDSPLTVEDQLADLVTFVDFSDTTAVEPVESPTPQHIDMLMDIGIEQAAQVHCLLSHDGTNYVDIEGGGDLTMTYNTRDGLRLFGRYTAVSGKMNYTLMVMALKDLTLKPGSSVEWTGDVMNPRLALSATERVKTTVYESSVPRSVAFDVGIAVSKTLDDMGLEFTLDAPDDITVSNQLASMTPESRGKVAVTMLATGMYLTDDSSTSGFSGTNALNAFLQNQISAISSKALSTIDLNFGIDNTNTASGATQTDYNFSFAKRFWGNRISLIIGGKVSSGADAQNTGQSIIDNVSLEYRLDKSATRFVRLYYDRNTESLMEGEIMEMGAGVVFRRKSTRLGELFIFRKKENAK